MIQPLRSIPITETSSLLRADPPQISTSIFRPRAFALVPFLLTLNIWFSGSIKDPVLNSCYLYTVRHAASKQVSAAFCPTLTPEAWFRRNLAFFDTSSIVRLRSSL